MNDLKSQLEKLELEHRNYYTRKKAIWEEKQNTPKKRPKYWDDKPIDFEVFPKLELEHRNYYEKKKAMKDFLEGAAYAKQLEKFKKRENF